MSFNENEHKVNHNFSEEKPNIVMKSKQFLEDDSSTSSVMHLVDI